MSDKRSDTQHTITISLPGDVPAEALHQRIKEFATYYDLRLVGDGLDWFLVHPRRLDVPEFLRQHQAPARRIHAPALSAVDEFDLTGAA